VKEASARLHCSTGTIYALCSARRLRCSRVGLGRGKIVISDEAIAEYLASREAGVEVHAPPPRITSFRHLHLSR